MKMLAVLLLLVTFSTTTFAHEKPKPSAAKTEAPSKRRVASEEIKCAANPSEGIGIDPDYIEKQIEAAKTCYEAANIAESCGAGSSLDNITAGAAITACDKMTGKLSKGDVALKKSMDARCGKICNPQNDGTMCLSAMAFCRLTVSKFMSSVNNKN